MAKTAASHVHSQGIKAEGNGWVKFVGKTADIGATTYWVGQAMELGDDGEFLIYTTAQPDYSYVTVAEPIVDDDRYALYKMLGGEVLHNQKLAGGYKVGDAVYQTAAGTWTYMDKDTAASIICAVGIVIGPADRITAAAVKDIDDAFSTTEPVDILLGG